MQIFVQMFVRNLQIFVQMQFFVAFFVVQIVVRNLQNFVQMDLEFGQEVAALGYIYLYSGMYIPRYVDMNQI